LLSPEAFDTGAPGEFPLGSDQACFQVEAATAPGSDGDGILDSTDACPNEPENINGFEDGDGCPDIPPSQPGPLVDLTKVEVGGRGP
jgi:hypothetical protein